MSDAPMTIQQMNLIYDSVVKAGYQGLADKFEQTITDLQAQNTRLRAEIEGEREARSRLDHAYREKDRAMGVLFKRLDAAGVDCSDLMS